MSTNRSSIGPSLSMLNQPDERSAEFAALAADAGSMVLALPPTTRLTGMIVHGVGSQWQ
jgi:hypothetical protein